MKKVFILCLMTVMLAPSFALAQSTPIGETKTAKGNILVIRNEKETPVHIGDLVYPNDIIRTGENSSVGIIFEDNTILSMGPLSEIMVHEYIFAPEKGMFSMIIKMMSGTASYVSGIIGKQSPGSVTFQTPDAAIGIRGTQFLVKVHKKGD